MLLEANKIKSFDLSHWKVVVGGSALPHGLAAAALSEGINVFAAYGLSETCPLLTVAHINKNSSDELATRCLAGWPAPMVDLRIVDANMSDVPRDGISTGEIVVRAPWLAEKYVKNDEATVELWRGGYLHTGDMGRIDFDGRLTITDRTKDAIKSGGEWISSLTLENIASSCDGVDEVAAIAISDKIWGERPMLVVVLAPFADKPLVEVCIRQQIQADINAGVISKWAMPEKICFVSNLAKTSVGKLDKKKIRAEHTR
jgi:fatty-acyl-CoA synthase